MIIAIGVMFVSSLLLLAAFTAANGEIHLSSSDTAQKKAYYAALAGIENYEQHLTQDGNYLTYCTEPPSTNPALNQVGETTHRATVPGTEGEPIKEQYAIQLLPAESSLTEHKCDPKNLVETMLEEGSTGAVGTFRIESTGYAGSEKRTLVATLRNSNFVSFVWYTKFETGDPAIYGEPPSGKKEYYLECAKFYGERPPDGGSPRRCINNFFINGESVNGPMHTEDHAGVCGSPVFGRNKNDRIEFRHAVGKPEDEGYSSEGLSCGGEKPLFLGKHIAPAETESIEPPPGDEELKHIVEPAYQYEGKTEIALEGSIMTVTTWKEVVIAGKKEFVKETTPNVAYPPNGVIYVAGRKEGTGCPEAYSPFGPEPAYTEDTGCANVYIHGNYTNSLTVASENDIVISGNITTTTNSSGTPIGNALLGLIANNFVRIYHPVEETYKGHGTKEEECNGADKYNTALKLCEYIDEAKGCDAPNSPSDMKEPTIYAAMLAVKHSVLVDNFDCGAPSLGNLNVYGAVAGLFTNGFTGQFSGKSIVHGYPYNANYDNRLQVEEPPHFLNPIQASWHVQRESLAPNPNY